MLEEMIISSIVNSGPWAMLTMGILIWFAKKIERVMERNTEVMAQVSIILQTYVPKEKDKDE